MSLRHITTRLDLKYPLTIPHAKSSQEAFTHPNLEPVLREEITPEITEELEKLTEIDSEVYAYARGRFNDSNGTNPSLDKVRNDGF